MNPNIIASYALLSGLKNAGVSQCVISPGSRSTPLAYVAMDLLECTVVIDERDAGFVALGIAESTRCPVIVITTSGSAPTHLYPSVVEAFHSNIPLIIVSADRPLEVRGRGAPQTIDQINLYGSAVRYFQDGICPHDQTDLNYWNETGVALSSSAMGADGVPGPVHLNMGMREPLSPDGDEKNEFENFHFEEVKSTLTGDSRVKPTKSSFGFSGVVEKSFFSSQTLKKIQASRNGLVTIGRSSNISRSDLDSLISSGCWPVLCDITSNFRSVEGTISSYDAVLRRKDAENFIPDVVIQFGEPLTSKLFNENIADSYVVSMKRYDDNRNPYGNAKDEVLLGDSTDECISEIVKIETTHRESLVDKWQAAQEDVQNKIVELKREQSDSEPALFIDLGGKLAEIESDMNILVASSMPIRYAEWFWSTSSKHATLFSHRGTNGIDGMISSAYGIAHGSKLPTLCVLGDVAFRHDVGFLSSCQQFSEQNSECVVFALVDNGGGAIFRHLDQAKSRALESTYTELLQTPTGIDFEAISKASGTNYYSSDTESSIEELASILKNEIPGTHVIHFKLDHESGPKFMVELKERLANL